MKRRKIIAKLICFAAISAVFLLAVSPAQATRHERRFTPTIYESRFLAQEKPVEPKPIEVDEQKLGEPSAAGAVSPYARRFGDMFNMPHTKEKYMTGEWFQLRRELENIGIVITSTYVGDFQGNPVGGKENGFRYNHSWGTDLNVNFEELMNWKGFQSHISFLWRDGRNLSADCIGNRFTVSSIYGSEQVRLYALYVQQSLWNDRFNFRIGRIGVGDDFTFDPIDWLYVSNAIDGNPVSIPINIKSYTTYPTATWGARWKYYPFKTKRFYSLSGIFNGDPNVGRMQAHGFDFTLKLDRGIFFAQEFGYENNCHEEDTGMPGRYRFGMYITTGKQDDLYEDFQGNSFAVTGQPKKRHRGNRGLYFFATQMIYQESPDSDQGLMPFVWATLAHPDMNEFPFFMDGGLAYKGPIPGYDYDTAMFGFSYGKWSVDMANSERDGGQKGQDYELMFEFSYKAAITPWFFLQPDIQYIINPGGRHDIEDALVLGMRVGITL